LNIPNDIAIRGFANEQFCEYLTPSLSTVNQQTSTMGEAAAKLFFDTPANYFQEGFVAQKLVLEPELVCRQSTAIKALNVP
jgi:LacI family transcriptional regulator